jgi:hypothetical protein
MTTEEAQAFFNDRAISYRRDDLMTDHYITEDDFMAFNEMQTKHDYSMGVAIKTIQNERKIRHEIQTIYDSFKKTGIEVLQFIEGSEWNMHGEAIHKLRIFLSLLKETK